MPDSLSSSPINTPVQFDVAPEAPEVPKISGPFDVGVPEEKMLINLQGTKPLSSQRKTFASELLYQQSFPPDIYGHPFYRLIHLFPLWAQT
jgi:hypothetical protein